MKKTRFTETQIVAVLKEVDSGVPVKDVCRNLVAPGTFILREHFNLPTNWKNIVKESRAVLKSLKQATDAKYILKSLHRRGITTKEINSYNLKPLLLEEHGFISCGKFLIGIVNLVDSYKKKNLTEWMYDVVAASPTPLTLKAIAKAIGEERIFPMYTIAAQAGKDRRLIRVGRATYGIAHMSRNIKLKEKRSSNLMTSEISPMMSWKISRMIYPRH